MTTMSQIHDLIIGMEAMIIGQKNVVERLVIGVLANGNLLVEGMPGLAKTRAIKALAKNLDAEFSRIQFTPDLLPSDVTGTEIYHQDGGKGSFRFDPGPVFANVILADEINRAPAKVQAALLEAMEERQVTVAGKTHPLPPLFIVLATQNPIEQEGTYPLPEAQMDRFLMHVMITYPPIEDEVEVIRLVRNEELAALEKETTGGGSADHRTAIPQDVILKARAEIARIHVSEAMERYMADLVYATREPAKLDDRLAAWIDYGASPRASLALDKCSRAHAWLRGRDYVGPQDIAAIAPDVFRHRLTLSFEAQGDGKTADDITGLMLQLVAVP